VSTMSMHICPLCLKAGQGPGGCFFGYFFVTQKSDSPVGETYGSRGAETAGPQAQQQKPRPEGQKNCF
ncbi:MAG: hypothetical protein FWD46_09235, partial [Cystobacterineae bacterium]|nr:hypothetical protein [Cystobacterineae bacterium]